MQTTTAAAAIAAPQSQPAQPGIPEPTPTAETQLGIHQPPAQPSYPPTHLPASGIPHSQLLPLQADTQLEPASEPLQPSAAAAAPLQPSAASPRRRSHQLHVQDLPHWQPAPARPAVYSRPLARRGSRRIVKRTGTTRPLPRRRPRHPARKAGMALVMRVGNGTSRSLLIFLTAHRIGSTSR